MQESTSAASPSRRELNKQATRDAISAAALRLAREQGPGGFTVDALADAAGVSRRTFFNYFPSIEAAVARPIEEFLDEAFSRLDERPADEPIVDAVMATLGGDMSREQMAVLCEVYAMTEDSPQLERMQLQLWNSAQQKLEDGLTVRLGPAAGELLVRALAGSLVACAKAAMRTAADSAAGRNPDPLAFHNHLLESIGLLRSGFNINGINHDPKDS
ncbi:TetR family transcriptional regulator [Arthrobacter crystallopoietes]|uniref:TetR/AcrR family transcriptional regulator n=1 Tax=Crystallibacter crystallopoietes TaxID=37928 RepID=UPI003D25D2D1